MTGMVSVVRVASVVSVLVAVLSSVMRAVIHDYVLIPLLTRPESLCPRAHCREPYTPRGYSWKRRPRVTGAEETSKGPTANSGALRHRAR
ncbi:putative membrane protein [Streptomyces davaonensis JCM 4913]|uniref:Putative membrane protein n=1 Tax=Streptomyces davaonensis (strain DSM 101723 / JCM 4913 / KCC S-0913 / 768) TaxID=1214101 RepID=K4R7H4_STRDJ|nr:putative membrane protein [Streptomyces davaonensis JCM 4913]